MLFARDSVVLCVDERRVRPTSLCFHRDLDCVKIPVQVPVRASSTTNFDGKGRLGTCEPFMGKGVLSKYGK
jgi:hypothetical protein